MKTLKKYLTSPSSPVVLKAPSFTMLKRLLGLLENKMLECISVRQNATICIIMDSAVGLLKQLPAASVVNQLEVQGIICPELIREQEELCQT